MADRGDTHYHVPNLNLWFLLSSLAFLGTMVWTVIDDWNAEWKTYQREFRTLELVKAEQSREELVREGAETRRGELQAAVEAAAKTIETSRDELATAEADEADKKATRWKIEQDYKLLKANLNWDTYSEEGDIIAGSQEPAEADRELNAARVEVFDAEYAFERATADYDAAKSETARIKLGLTEAEAALAAGTRDLKRVEDRIEALSPSDVAVQAADVVRDFPGLDFIGPKLKVNKYVLSNLTFELNFTKKTRIDMCATCHMGMESPAFQAEPNPFKTHPRLDLYLSSSSPHPAKDIGCTICHRGSGESLSFQHADHRPSDAQEAERWHHDYNAHKQHHWDYPMLSDSYIEASCVQCHKTSMELIADDAPKVTEGYRLAERYGCFSCHKIDWFPTKRKPGPSLKNLAAKVTPDFASAWIAAPKAFRPTTWMPQLFHLENLPADEVVVKSRWEKGREILGQEWNDAAVAAITTFLFENHPKQDLPAIPVEGDPERGREVMNLSGCYACHNTAPYEGGDPLDIASNVAGEFNTKGPNLRGVATKIDATWLYNWVKDPAAYWADTNMPNLRLSDQDAADITAYVMQDPDGIFMDVPDGWQEGASPSKLEVLQEMARWFYTKLGRHEIERRLGLDPVTGEPAQDTSGAEWTDETALASAVGEALVRNHGCYSCHEIGGMENDMPIGTELSNWGSKTVDKLDFAMHYRKEVAGLPQLDKYYREGWIERKLMRPRSYDAGKVKSPKDKLRMPFFDFTEEQAQALATFVVGLVDDEVQRAKMEPTPAQLAMDTGMRAVRQKNCMACHVLEPGQVLFNGPDGTAHAVQGQILALTDEPLPPTMASKVALDAERVSWEEYTEEELDEYSVVLYGPEPELGKVASEKVAVPVGDLIDVKPSIGGEFVHFVTRYYKTGGRVPNPDYDPNDEDSYPTNIWTLGFDEDTELDQIEDVDGVQRNYSEEEYDKVRWTFAPPVLLNEGHKLQREWFYAFLKHPTTIRKQIRVRMPSFTYADGEAEAIAEYFAEKARQDWYVRYAKTLRASLGRTLHPDFQDANNTSWDTAEYGLEWPPSGVLTQAAAMSIADVAVGAGLTPKQVREIEAGYAPTIAANFHKLLNWGTQQGFSMTPQLSPDGYELIERRTPTHLAMRESLIPFGRQIAENAETGVNCYQCHPNGSVYPETPIAWAPPLTQVRERLREEWVREWLWSPKFVYPGTAMPDNFTGDPPQYQVAYPNSSNEDQIQAVLDWVFNMDRSVAGEN